MKLFRRRPAPAQTRHADTVTIALAEYQRMRDEIAGLGDKLELARMQADASYRDKRAAETSREETIRANGTLRRKLADAEARNEQLLRQMRRGRLTADDRAAIADDVATQAAIEAAEDRAVTR